MQKTRRIFPVLALTALLVAPAGLAGCSSADSTPAAPTATSAEGAAAIAKPASPQRVDVPTWVSAAEGAGTVIIDVRTPEEFAAGHVVGALNIPVELPGFAEAISQLDPEATYAVYCRTGSRSAFATAEMAGLGYLHIFDLNGGFSDLQGTSLPTT
jgi:phage shock protein E